MSTANIRFYEELNDFHPPTKRKVQSPGEFSDQETIKRIIESENVPHVEVDLIRAWILFGIP